MSVARIHGPANLELDQEATLISAIGNREVVKTVQSFTDLTYKIGSNQTDYTEFKRRYKHLWLLLIDSLSKYNGTLSLGKTCLGQ